MYLYAYLLKYFSKVIYRATLFTITCWFRAVEKTHSTFPMVHVDE